MSIFSTPRTLVGIVSLSGVVAGGAGIYTLIPFSSNHQEVQNTKKLSDQRRAFEKLKFQYSYSRLFNGSSGRSIRVETIDPDDQWWSGRWEKYKTESPASKLTEGEKAKAKGSLEDFQTICFQEIRKWGGYFPSTALYATDEGKLNISTHPSGHSGSDELDEQRFAWEWCSKVTVTKG